MNKDIYLKVSKELNIPVEIVELAYRQYWNFIKETIEELPLKSDINEEEFAKLKTSFNIASIGKLYCNHDKYLKLKKTKKYIKEKHR